MQGAKARTIILQVPADLSDVRFDTAVARLCPELSRAAAQRLIREGNVLLNGRASKPSESVKTGDELRVTIPPPVEPAARPQPIALNVVYEDEDLIVVNKPSGMVVHPGAGNPDGTLVNALLHHCRELAGVGGKLRPGIVHRLDKETSGLLVAAKNDAAYHSLQQQIQVRTAVREYWALVWGCVENDEGRIEAPIGRHPRHRQKMAANVPHARNAITDYRVLERFKRMTLLQAHLQTGRTHQVRVHFAHIGHPVVGDPLYGRGRASGLAQFMRELVAGLHGQALHARRLCFDHPHTGERLEFEAPLPEDFATLLDVLRKPS